MTESLYEPTRSNFERRLEGIGRVLEFDEYVWCCSPIYDDEGKIHIFYSSWPKETEHKGWLTHSCIKHAVSDKPEGPFVYQETVLTGSGTGDWRSQTVHNPSIHKVGNQYALFFIANSDGTQKTKRAGLALADSLHGPWTIVGDQPILEPSKDKNKWDYFQTTNPAYLHHPNGEHWLYYKSHPESPKLRMIGGAMAKNIEGPYIKYEHNPMLDYSQHGLDIEDPYVFMEKGTFIMLIRDRLGVINDRMGLYYESDDGLNWQEPKVAYGLSTTYFGGDVHRFERPQILMKNGKPEYLYMAMMGGKYNLSTGSVLKIHDSAIR